MKIIFVKKILSNGQPCKKCASMLYKLESSENIEKIHRIAIAYEGDINSEGYILANKYQQYEAPFFIIEHDDLTIETISTYDDFLRVIFNS